MKITLNIKVDEKNNYIYFPLDTKGKPKNDTEYYLSIIMMISLLQLWNELPNDKNDLKEFCDTKIAEFIGSEIPL